jgi:hypothetical protein
LYFSIKYITKDTKSAKRIKIQSPLANGVVPYHPDAMGNWINIINIHPNIV